MVFKIAVSEGHGRHTAGKRTPAGEREWMFNNWQGQGFRQEMNNYSGVAVRLVSDPTGQRDVPLSERTNIANSWGADLYQSFHHNAFRGIWGNHTGTETYIHNGNVSANTRKYANAAHKGIVDVYKLHDRGIKRANFHELRVTRMPANLTEGGYMDSTIDVRVLRNKELVMESGRNVAREVAKAAGLKRRSGATKPSTPPNNVVSGTIYRVQVGAFKQTAGAANFSVDVEKKAKVSTYIVSANGFIRVQVGAYTSKKNAETQLKRMKDAGYKDAFITTNNTQSVPEAEPNNEPVQSRPQSGLSISQMADKILSDSNAPTGNARAAWLGISMAEYQKVQAEINRRYGSSSNKLTITQMANKVINSPNAPKGDKRAAWLGITLTEYRKVQAEINRILGVKPASAPKTNLNINQMADRIINDPKAPTGDARAKWLGISIADYRKVQAEINRRYSGGGKTSPKTISNGSRVKIKSSANKYVTGENILSSIKNKTYTVMQVKSNSVLLKEIMSWVYTKDIV